MHRVELRNENTSIVQVVRWRATIIPRVDSIDERKWGQVRMERR